MTMASPNGDGNPTKDVRTKGGTSLMSILMLLSTPVIFIALAMNTILITSSPGGGLMRDYTVTPPYPIFMARNMLAAVFQNLANKFTPPNIRALDMMNGYQHSMLLYTCIHLGIPDYLASGPKTIDEIAEHTGTYDKTRVQRLMYALASIGLTEIDQSSSTVSDDVDQIRFTNNDVSSIFRKDHPNSNLGAVVQTQYEFGITAWRSLPDSFGADNAIAWDLAFPKFPGGPYSMLEDSPRLEEIFSKSMASWDTLLKGPSLEDVPWSKFTRFVDIGGSKGHFLSALLEKDKTKKGLLFDRPGVISIAQELWKEKSTNNLTMLGGSFFDPDTLPQAQPGDVWFLRNILHNWGRDSVRTILTNLRSKMKKDKTVMKDVTLMLGEFIIPDHESIGQPAMVYRLDMHMMTLFGEGQERTAQQWSELLPELGFELVKIHPTRSPLKWVEARPV